MSRSSGRRARFSLQQFLAGHGMWFYNQVKDKGPWDYKYRDAAINEGKRSKYEPFGNFNYGAVGAAAGFTEGQLLRLAMHYQTDKTYAAGEDPGLLRSILGTGGLAPYGDEPADQDQIRSGINYYRRKLVSRIVNSMRNQVILLVALLFVACGACGEDKLAETNSPDNKYVATVFRRACGATTGFLYHVNIRSSSGSFSADHKGAIESGQIFLTREGKLNIRWKDNKTLEVSCTDCPKDHKPTMESWWNDVSISYELH